MSYSWFSLAAVCLLFANNHVIFIKDVHNYWVSKKSCHSFLTQYIKVDRTFAGHIVKWDIILSFQSTTQLSMYMRTCGMLKRILIISIRIPDVQIRIQPKFWKQTNIYCIVRPRAEAATREAAKKRVIFLVVRSPRGGGG